MIRILFLCTHNSCRSLMAEGLLRHLGRHRVLALSAGSHPSGTANPHAMALLRKQGIATRDLHSKSWDVFANNVEKIDVVITVCGDAAEEVCPHFPGAPVKAHWPTPDPSRSKNNSDAAFLATYKLLEARIRHLLSLPLSHMTPDALEQAISHIGSASYKMAA